MIKTGKSGIYSQDLSHNPSKYTKFMKKVGKMPVWPKYMYVSNTVLQDYASPLQQIYDTSWDEYMTNLGCVYDTN